MSPPNRLGGIESDKHGMMEFWSNGVMEFGVLALRLIIGFTF